MSVLVTVNGTSYTIPQSGETGWGVAVTGWIQSVSNSTLQKTGGSFVLTAEVDFGATYGIKSAYVKSQTANVSATGVIRLARTDIISWRDNANAADLELGVNASDELTFNGNAILPSSPLTASRALQTSAGSVIEASAVTSTELGYVAGVASAIQTQINGKEPTIVTLSKAKGGSGQDNSSITFPASGVLVTEAGTQTLTNKTLTTPAISSPTGLVKADVGLSNVDNTSDATKNSAVATLSSKTLTAPVVNDGVFNVLNATDQGSTPANPSAGTTKVYSKTDGKVYKLTSAGVEQELGAGAGGGSINYISANPDAETSTTGWATYKDAAQATPVDGTGGSPALTFTRSTSSPLRGTGSFLITTTAANLQGEGASYDFTLSTADQAKMLSISFDYNIASGTYVTGDMAVYIYDVTNALVIQPAGYQIQAMGSTLPNKHIATFQTSSNSTSYRLIFHRAVSTASASTMKIDNVQVGPQVVQYGAPVTDWVSYTPTLTHASGGITNATASGKWRRVGDSMEVVGRIVFSAASAAFNGLYGSIPSGSTIDTSKLSSSTAEAAIVGTARMLDLATQVYGPGVVSYNTTTTVRIDSAAVSGAAVVGGLSNTTPFTYGANDEITWELRVPITGWSSTVQMSNDTDTRVVAFVGDKGSTQAVTANVTNITVTSVKDSHGAWSGSTYVVPVPGDYIITAGFVDNAAATVTAYEAYVNTVLVRRISQSPGGVLGGGSTVLVNLKAGDIVSVRCTATLTLAASGSIGISRISGPSAIAASETVAASYSVSAATSIANGSTTVVDFATKIFDTHNAVTTGATWKFTAPISGKYLVTAIVTSASGGGWAVGEEWNIFTGVSAFTTRLGQISAQAAHGIPMSVNGSVVLNMLAGQYVQIGIFQNSGAALNTSSDPVLCHVDIVRVGN